MNLMLFELIGIGFFQCLLSFEENPWIFCLGWIFVLLGAVLQFLFLRKGKRWGFPLFLLFLCVVGEVLCQVITGIELLVALIGYGLSIVLLMGAVFTTILFTLWKRREQQ